MKSILKVLLSILLIIILYFSFWPIDLEPLAFKAPENPGFTGVFSHNNDLTKVNNLLKDIGVGPEDIAFRSDSLLFTGLEDGRIVQFSMDGLNFSEFANTGGRPLGMKFDSAWNLIVADEKKGLLSIDSTGQVSVLTDQVNGSVIYFADDLDITKEGIIYFTDATQRNHDIIHEAFELQPSGRLLSYHPSSKETKLELDSLMFANGVTLGPNEEYLLVNETFAFSITKYWLKGPKKGQTEIFTNNLPGFPDNINYDGQATFWLAIPNMRPPKEFEALYDKPFWRKVLLRMPEAVYRGVEPDPFGMVLGYDLEGNVSHNYQDTTGGFYYITSVSEFNGSLWLGSLKMEGIGKYELNNE